MNNIFFFKRLAFLIRGGVPLSESLLILQEQTSSRRERLVVGEIVSDVEKGKPLSHALGKFPNIFSDFSRSVIAVAEQSGGLPQNLEYVAEALRKKHLLKRTIVGAFIYPALIVVATLGIAVFLMLYLFPKIIPVFSSLHAVLPLSTRMLIGMSVFLEHWGFAVLVVILFLACGATWALKSSWRFRVRVQRTCLSMPALGGMLKHYTIAQSGRTLGLLLQSGVTLSRALAITADATPNLVYKKQFQVLCGVVERGDRMSAHLKKTPAYFPEIFSHLIAVGEKSGSLSETLLYLSSLYEHEVEDFTKNLSTLIEPVLMIFMGLLVGFIAISIITPIYGITQNLH